MDTNLPVSSRKQLRFDGFRVDRVLIHAGAFQSNPAGDLRIIATLGGGWELQMPHGETVHYDHGEICLLPSTLQRRSMFREHGDNLLISVGQALLERLAREAGSRDAARNLSFQKLSNPFVYQITHALAEELGPGVPRGTIYVESLVLALLGYLLRGGVHAAKANELVGGGLSLRKLRTCESYLDSHIGGSASVDDLAQAVNMSRYHFAREFKKATGKTPHRFVLERRIERARLQVANTGKPLNEIAAELGFRSQSHFSSVYRALTGQTPSADRRTRATKKA